MIEYAAQPLDVMQLSAALHLCPHTLQGALKAACGEGAPACGGVFYRSGEEAFFPMPLGLVKPNSGELAMLTPLKNSFHASDLGQKDLHVLWAPGGAGFQRPGGLISGSGLAQYLRGEIPDPSSLVAEDRFVAREQRAGYPDVYRCGSAAEIRVLLETAAPDLLPPFLGVGGGGHAMHLAPAKEATLVDAPPPGRSFKLVFLTPALFEHGWRPRWLGNDGIGKIGDVVCRLAAFVNGGALQIGGWDGKAEVPRRVRAAVRPGSEYYFEVLEGDPEELRNLVHWRCVSDARQRSGFGLCVLGNWRYAG